MFSVMRAGNCTRLRINDAAVTKGVTGNLDFITTPLVPFHVYPKYGLLTSEQAICV